MSVVAQPGQRTRRRRDDDGRGGAIMTRRQRDDDGRDGAIAAAKVDASVTGEEKIKKE